MAQTASELSDAELLAIIGQPASAASSARPSGGSLGERNHNQGNLKDGAFARSQPGYTGANGSFATFATPEDGNRAQETLLANNYLSRGYNTPSAIVNRYAPPGPENSPESVANYTNYIANKLGIDANAPISTDQVGALAQAMREFETGQTSGGSAALADDVSAMDDAALMSLVQGEQPAPSNLGEAARPGATQDNPFVITDETPRELLNNLPKGTYIATKDEEDGKYYVNRLSGSPYINHNGAEGDQVVAGGNAYLHTPGVEDATRAFTTAAAEQVPFLDEGAAMLGGALSGEGYDVTRQRQLDTRQIDNESNDLARDVGGIAGFGLGLAAPGGSFINAGKGVAAQTARAAIFGGGAGGLYGAGNTEGDLGERAEAGVLGAALGAATGGVAQRFLSSAAATAPSAARRLSREGVDLTPGTMFGETPLVGPVMRSVEEGATSIPVIGSLVSGARQRSTDTFNRAAINRSLLPIGAQLPKGKTGGYQAIEFAQNALGEAYDKVLPNISAQLDRGLYDDLAGIMTDAASEMPPELLTQLGRVLQDRVFRNVDQASAVLDGPALKRIESELGAIGREYRRANDPSQLSFGRAVDDFRTSLRDMIARQNPAEAKTLQRINQGYANLVRVEDAAGSTASQAAEGVFSPTQLGVAANRGASRSSRARGGANMQDLAAAGRAVLPSRTGDSGTATRGGLTALAAGAGTVVNPVVAGTTAAITGVAYSPLAQRLLNGFYRATDIGGKLRALSEFRALAARNPALVPYLEQATQQLRGGAPSQSQPTAQPAGALPLPTSP